MRGNELRRGSLQIYIHTKANAEPISISVRATTQHYAYHRGGVQSTLSLKQRGKNADCTFYMQHPAAQATGTSDCTQ